MGIWSNQPRRRAWHDRYGGVMIAGPLSLCALIISMIMPVTQWRREEPPPKEEAIYLTLEMEELAPEPEPPPPIEETFPMINPQFLQEVVATHVDSQEDGEEMLTPTDGDLERMEEEPEPEMAQVDPAASLEDWIPSTNDAAELQIIRSEVAQQSRALERRRHDLQASIQNEQIKSAAREFELTTDGGSEGQIRLLNVEHYPHEKVVPILSRYGITYERRHITPSAGRSFLNAAVTNQGTFTNAPAEGYYEVFVLSSYATSQLAMMEIEALGERGFNPKTSRIRKVVFGIIINRQGEADLGVTDIEIERVR